MEKTVLTGFLDCLRDGRPKLQQAYLNILIILFAGGSIYSSHLSSPQLSALEDSLRSIRYYFLQISTQLFVILCRLIDQGGSVAIKGKALLTIELICRYQPTLLSSLCEHRLQHILSKLFDSNQSFGQDNKQKGGVDDRVIDPSSTAPIAPPPPYVSECVQSFISWIQFLLSHSVLEMIQDLRNFTHLTSHRVGRVDLGRDAGSLGDETIGQLPPPPPEDPSFLLTTPSKGINPLVTPVKSSPKSSHGGGGSSIKQSKSTPILGVKTVMSPSLTTRAPVATSSTAGGSATSIAVLRGCISLISHPSLQKHVITSRYLISISTALQLISEIFPERKVVKHHQSPPLPSEDQEFLVLSEQSILLALESVSQVPYLSHPIPVALTPLRSTSWTLLSTLTS